MVVAVVLSAFEASDEGDLLDPADLEHFVRVWAEFDPDATWFINACDVQKFLSKLQPPLGMAGQVGEERGELYTKDPCLLEIAVNSRRQVNIVNVATLLAKRLAKKKQGDQFGELSADHPIHGRATRYTAGMSTTLGDVYVNS
eukprot:CAMPEP_0183720140 /NCGR_PEP_ID=MMETSP0737-20130205/12842_1 /TAXON_ID=385413 /ORGANISM="Thalassiosira miniscula, Strain CCMP1093" /LENGTH=142 /DNA_ID=CAMNT_0025949957 /DNA_START=18 /DNA_END=443 /DNA_ORIENTATION=+